MSGFYHKSGHHPSPNLGEDDYNAMNWTNIPVSSPKHFDKVIWIMNWCLLSSLKFSPKELLLGLVVNTKPTNINLSMLPTTEQDVSLQMAYVAQQWLDGYAEAVDTECNHTLLKMRILAFLPRNPCSST